MTLLSGFLKPLVPPLVLDLVNGFRNRTFIGPFQDWESARSASRCDYSRLLEDVKQSLLKVVQGEAACVVDSVSLSEAQYNWPLLAMLLKAANDNAGSLRVLDFGGSLGTVYFQNRKLLRGLNRLSWCVLEQPSFVEAGRELFQNEELSFHRSDECAGVEAADLILVSGVLQYLEDPFSVLKELFHKSARYVVVDRTPFILSAKRDLLTVQKLPKHMHEAGFPHWFFSKRNFLEFCTAQGYDLIAEFEGYKCLPANVKDSAYCGFVFERSGMAGAVMPAAEAGQADVAKAAPAAGRGGEYGQF